MRHIYDAKARNKDVQRQAVDLLNKKHILHILDVGAGLGANVRYYAPLFPCHQDWTLVEQDKHLAQEALTELCGWAEGNGWMISRAAKRIRLVKADQMIIVRVIITSFLTQPFPTELGRLDLVTANAVFDLISETQFLGFARQLAGLRVPLLATLNYTGMSIIPTEEDDLMSISLFEKHMTRRQGFGRAMGSGCAPKMISILEDLGYTVVTGQSLWQMTNHDSRMLRFLLRFIEKAVPEVLSTQAKRKRFEIWISNKRKQETKGNLTLTIHHIDLLAS